MRRLALGGAVIVGVVGAGLLVFAPVFGAPQDKVTICHRSNSVHNPYVEQQVNENSIVMPDGTPDGHGLHSGPVFPQTDASGDWGDIIPSFEYTNDHGGTSVYPGMNNTGHGGEILEAGCLVDLVEPPESTTTTTTTTVPPEVTSPTTPAPTTPTTPAPTTPTTPAPTSAPTTPAPTTGPTIPPEIETTLPGETTVPGATTTLPGATTTVPGTPTTTLVPPSTAPPTDQPPPLTDPPEGVEIMPPTEAEAIDPPASTTTLPGGTTVPGATTVPGEGDVTNDVGALTPQERVTLEQDLDPVPAGAPGAGLGGASTPNGPATDWTLAGLVLVVLAAVSGGAAWWYYRRRV
jgi:hypothetical protein